MEESLFESLKLSLNEAIEHAEGKVKVRKRKVTIRPVPVFNAYDIKNIRKNLGLTQSTFAQLFGVSKKTVEAWEAGTNLPNGSAMRLLQLFVENPALAQAEVIVEDELEFA